jgi:hypothetical protein
MDCRPDNQIPNEMSHLDSAQGGTHRRRGTSGVQRGPRNGREEAEQDGWANFGNFTLNVEQPMARGN